MLKKWFIFLTVAAALGIITNTTYADDNQAWTIVGVKGDLTENIDVGIQHEMHFVNDAKDFVYQHFDFGLETSLSDNWSISLNIREAYSKKGETWSREDRPHFNLTYKNKLGNLKVKNRLRAEWRFKENKDEYWRFRDKIGVTFPFELVGITPSIANEFFIDTESKKYNQNRVFIGGFFGVTDNIKCQLDYIWITEDKDEEWINTNVGQIQIKMAI